MVHHDPDQPPPMAVYAHRFAGLGAFIGLGIALGVRAHRNWRNR